MPEINAYRMDGLGNDFIIVDRRENSINLSKEKIIKLGDRKVLGFDQILFIENWKVILTQLKFITQMVVKLAHVEMELDAWLIF